MRSRAAFHGVRWHSGTLLFLDVESGLRDQNLTVHSYLPPYRRFLALERRPEMARHHLDSARAKTRPVTGPEYPL